MTTAIGREDKILSEIPILGTVPVIIDGRGFYADSIAEALRACQQEGYEAAFMPQIAQARILTAGNGRKERYLEEIIWLRRFDTASIVATGRTRAGKDVVVVGHVPNYLSNPDNIEATVNHGLINGAGILPQNEFYRLLGMEDGRTVFVIDHSTLYYASTRGVLNFMAVADADKHPLAAAFLGGTSTLDAYLAVHERYMCDEKISVRYDEDVVQDVPVGRLLTIGNFLDNVILGNVELNHRGGRVVGVRQGAEGAAPQKQASPLEELAGKARDAGNGVLVINARDLSPGALKALMGGAK